MNPTKHTINSIIGSIIVSAAAISPCAGASENPFTMVDLGKGYQVAETGGQTEPQAGQGMKKMEGKCGGMMKGMMDTNKDGKVSKEEYMKHHEQMFEMKDKDKNGVLDESEMGPRGGMMKPMEGEMGGMKHGKDAPSGQ
jgi:hypothetical protein